MLGSQSNISSYPGLRLWLVRREADRWDLDRVVYEHPLASFWGKLLSG